IPGDVRLLDVGEHQYMLSDGAFLASTTGVALSTKSQGLGRALLGGSGGFFIMKTEGSGTLAVSGFGSLREIQVTPDKPVFVDNGHLVAWDQALDYELSLNTGRTGLLGKLVNSQTTGEGIVLRFRGSGTIWVCSRHKGGFIDWICETGNLRKAPAND
ncbi:protein containing DUF124, partial [gut metagenome]